MPIFDRLLDIPSSDPDDARRGKLLNILLLGTTVLVVLFLLVFLLIDILKGIEPWMGPMTITSLILQAGIIVTYFLNKKRSGKVAGIAFLLFITIVFTFSDSWSEVSSGRSLFIFIIPIIMASVLLEPASSLIFSTLSSVIISVIALSIGQEPNLPAIGGYFMVALISWLSAHDLQRALKEVRQTNAELDERVSARTQELSESLARESEQASQRQAILQGIADGVMVFDPDGKVILSNPALSRLIDIPLDQINGNSYTKIMDAAQLPDNERLALIETLKSIDTNGVQTRIHWDEKTLSVNAAPVQDVHAQIIGYVGVFRNFTHEARIEEMKNSFVAMVSHELRTPLNAILGYSEMLRDAYYGPLNDKQVNAADRILNNSRRLLEIVNDLMDKAQIEAGHLNLNIVPFNTAELAEYLHSVMDKVFDDKGLELNIQIAEDIPPQITGDMQRIQQVMVNLVNNAAKFTETGGIQVKIYKVAEMYWAFDVIDSGPGIAAENQKTIFEPFSQLDKTIALTNGGIGLGLSIVKRLIDLMGGRIFLKSTVGEGSTFSVILPFEPPQKESDVDTQ